MASIYRRKKGGCFYITYFVRPGQRKTLRACKDRAATEALARKLEADAMLRAKGVIDGKAEQYTKWETTPLADHVDAFEGVLHGRSVTAKYIKATVSYVRTLARACGFSTPAEIDAATVSAYVADLKRKGKGLRAINAEVGAFKSFTRWLVRAERMRTDPMVSVSNLNTRTERRHPRRALSDAEIVRLLDAAERGPRFRGFTGPERAMLYRLALETGLRASELGSLTPGSFLLGDVDQATVTVEAACSKHRREDVLPLRREMAEAVAAFVEGKEPQAVLFRMPDKPADMLKRDLKAAGILYRDASGRVADFHALRHTFITRLARSGVTPAVAKSLARHSTITLTMDHYTHTLMEDERSALDRLPALGPDGQERESARATGTDDVYPPGRASPDRQPPPPARSALSARRHPDRPGPARTCPDEGSRKKKGEVAQVVVNATTCAHSPAYVTGGAEGIRTPDLLIANQPLSQLSYGPTQAAHCTGPPGIFKTLPDPPRRALPARATAPSGAEASRRRR